MDNLSSIYIHSIDLGITSDFIKTTNTLLFIQ